jgi:stage V sporulation protein D (sporulation-specific penicillin-binding protein)
MASKDYSVTRIWLLSLGILGFAGVLVFRLYLVQIAYGEDFLEKANNQYFRVQPDLFDRGDIFFQSRNGSFIPAAVQESAFTVSINPEAIKNYDFTFLQLSSVLDLDTELFMTKIAEGGTYQEIASGLNLIQAEQVRKLDLLGVSFKEERWRTYPGGSIASHALGIVAYKGDELGGRYGLERTYERILKRSDNRVSVNYFAQVFANVKESFSGSSAKEGDIVVTIEPSVQVFLEEELRKLNEEWNSEFSGGIIVNPRNGEIVSLSVYPGFNPNNFKEEDPGVFSNPLVESVFEMGSIMKTLTLAAGLDAKAITPETTYFDAGTIYLDRHQISNYDGKARGLVNMQSVINNSLNTGATFIMRKIGKDKFSEYMFDFGLGEKSKVDLPNEAANLVENLNSPREIEHATASFGQGIALTPMSTVKALSALANGGVLTTPHLLKKINYIDGQSKNISAKKGNRVIKKETAEEVTRMLVKVVDNALLGGTVKLPNFNVAAKTGTAQIAREDARGYYDDRFFHSFFGYFPAFDARFLVFLFTYNPKEVRYASETLTHPFIGITKFLINYYEIPPDR